MLKEDIIKRISDEYDRLIEKYEGHPLIEQEGILLGFADIINDFYDCGGEALDNKEKKYDDIKSYVEHRLEELRKDADNKTWDIITKSTLKIRIEELELLKRHFGEQETEPMCDCEYAVRLNDSQYSCCTAQKYCPPVKCPTSRLVCSGYLQQQIDEGDYTE